MRFAAIRSLLTDAQAPVFIAPSATAADAVRLMEARRAPAVVVQQARALGIVSNSEIVEAVVTRHCDPDATPVSDFIGAVESVEGSTPLERVWSDINDRALRYVAIRDGDRVVGVVSRTQVMQWILRSQEEEVDCALHAVKRFAVANRRPF